MIHNLLPVVCGELNSYFKTIYDTDEDSVQLTNLISQDGSVAVEGNNKVVCFLANIEEETTLKSNSGTKQYGDAFASSASDINVNLTVVFSAYFLGQNYIEALKFLSGVLYFFQSKKMFTPENTPGLSSSIDKAVFDITSLSFHDQNAIFSMMGAKYMPSVIYRIRMLRFSSDEIDGNIPAVSGISTNTKSKDMIPGGEEMI